MRDGEAEKPERRRVGWGKGVKAWLPVYYKLKILPRHEGGWGGGCTYLCLSPQTQQLGARRPRVGSTSLQGGTTGGREGMWFCICSVVMAELRALAWRYV